MKIQIIVAAMLIATSAFAAEQTWTGTISDKMCGADHTQMRGKMSDRDCTLASAKGGAPYALVVDGKVYELSNHESEVKTHAGNRVSVTGEVNGNAIRVSRVEAVK